MQVRSPEINLAAAKAKAKEVHQDRLDLLARGCEKYQAKMLRWYQGENHTFEERNNWYSSMYHFRGCVPNKVE